MQHDDYSVTSDLLSFMTNVGVVRKLHPEGKLPVKPHPAAVGFEVYPVESGAVLPQYWKRIPTGITITPPLGTCIRIAPLYWLSNRGVWVSSDVVEPVSSTELEVLVHNFNSTPFFYTPYRPVAQIIFVKIDTPFLRLDEDPTFEDSIDFGL